MDVKLTSPEVGYVSCIPDCLKFTNTENPTMTTQLLLALLIFFGTVLIFRVIWTFSHSSASARKYELTTKFSSYIASLFILAFLGVWPNISNADKKIDATKTVTWDIPVVPAPAANVFGRYT
jgi:hypothetical protein